MPFQIDGLLNSQDNSFAGAGFASTGPDRRQKPRFPIKPRMFLVRMDGLPAVITLKDISCGGAAGLMSEPVVEGACLIIELDAQTHVRARVRWIARMTIGLEFLTPLDPSFVATFCRRHDSQA